MRCPNCGSCWMQYSQLGWSCASCGYRDYEVKTPYSDKTTKKKEIKKEDKIEKEGK